MTFDYIVAALIRHALESASLQSHERVLVRRYDRGLALPIVEQLLDGAGSTRVGLTEDDGGITERELPAVRWTAGSQTIEVLPFVVSEEVLAGDLAWLGSQGFASRLRTSFSLGAEQGVTRVLVLFDSRPVETEQTTTSESLSEAVDSLDSLVDWFDSAIWKAGFAPQVFERALEVVRWWRARLIEQPGWSEAPHHELLEQAATFMEACRPSSAPSGVGKQLPSLGLLFRDPGLLEESDLDKRLNRNADEAYRLDSFRRQRILDPLAEAARVIDLGPSGEQFHDELAARLRSPTSSVTQADVTLQEVWARLRTKDNRPAWMDVMALDVVALGPRGEPQGESLQSRLITEVGLPPNGDRTYEVIVPCPTTSVRVTIPLEGDLRAFLYQDGVLFNSDVADDEGGLRPRARLALDFARPQTFSVVELLLREKNPRQGRLPRPTQTVLLGVVAGESVAVPENSSLDPGDDSFVVDGAADSIKVQVGGREVRVVDNLPPLDGSVAEVEVGGVEFRWKGEDRSPSDTSEGAHRRTVRLLELAGVGASGDPRDIAPYYTEEGELGATCRTSATLDVAPSWMREESELLLNPGLFAGVESDNEAATAELERVAAEPFRNWHRARESFVRAVCESCERALPSLGAELPSMYLADLRKDELGGLARGYVDTYGVLLEAVAGSARAAANRALIEPVLLCDRAPSVAHAIRLAPTHPIAVAFLSSVQRGFLSAPWGEEDARTALAQLLKRPLLSGVIPWVPWRGEVLIALQTQPLLWRCYGTEGGTLDTSDELGPVVVQKVKRLLSLAPHLNASGQVVYLNVEIGHGEGKYLGDALRALQRDNTVQCTFDVGIVSAEGVEPALVRAFGRSTTSEGVPDRERLQAFVRVRRLGQVGDREAHVVFRMEAADSDKQPFASMSRAHSLVRETGFAGGLSQEPARFAITTANEVTYTSYVAAGEVAPPPPEGLEESSWDGEWRRRFLRLGRLSRHAAVGLQSEIRADSIPCQTLRQIADGTAGDEYDRSFVTVHCDPAQGPEFFVGARTQRSGVFLVECSDRGSPELPGRDVVSVTSRIGPFRAALATAVSALPTALCELAEDDDVARGLLRDINLLRGTEVFDFLREISRNSHIYLMDGLDNVLALRFLLSDDAQLPGYLPVVVAMKDLTARSAPLSELRRGTQCDDVLVFYLPKFERAPPVVLYRLVEVKFGPRRGRPRTKAQQQLSETAQKLAMKLPTGRWLSEQSPTALLLERDVAWTLHEALERLRAFGLLPDDEAMEAEWGLRGLFGCLHRGDFELKPYVAGFPGASQLVNGTAMMLDPNIPGDSIDVTVEGATEYLTIPLGLIADLLVNPVTGVAGHAIEARKAIPPPASGLTTTSPDEPETPARETSAESTGRPPTGGPADGGDETHSGEGGGQKVEAATPTNQPMALSSDLRGTEKSAGDEEGRTRPRADADSARDEALLRVDQVFDGFIGNTGPVTRLKRALTIASLEGRRWIEPVGLFGPKSTGKTELARRISRALGLPKAELSETLLRGADDLARKIQETANEAGSTMRMESDPHGGVTLHAPPMVVFIDEVHLLRSAVQDSLLKALEPDDRTLLSTLGTIDTRQVTFIIATTDPGRLREPFKNRVARYELREYTLDELTQILAAHRERRDDIPAEASQFNDECLEVFARVGRHVPREALRLMREAARAVRVGFLNPTLEALKTQYRDEYGADDTGLRTGDRDYLRILFPDFTVGVEALAAQLGVDPNNVSEDLEPYLLRLGLIERGRTGRRLTAQGREFASSLPD